MDNQQASDADFTRPFSERNDLSQNVPPPNTIVFRQDEPAKQLLMISEKMGTVGIDLDPEWLRTLILSNPDAAAAYKYFSNVVTQHNGTSEEVFHDTLHVLLAGAINAFHQNVYSMCYKNSGIPMPNATETPNVD